MVIKIKKTKKSKKLRGTNSHSHGARKKWKGSGHRGGIGMAGTGKRGDQKKSLVIKKYGNKYFGRQGVTSRGTARKKDKIINLRDIQNNLDSLIKKYGKGNELKLTEFKILGKGELKNKLNITAKTFTPGAKEKIEKAGGKVTELQPKKAKIEMVE